MASLGNEIGGPARADDMLKGRGVSLILKSISMNYKAPVTYPDTLLVAHKPHEAPSSHSHRAEKAEGKESGSGTGAGRKTSRTHMHVKAVAYSYKQKRIVTESDSVAVWYDYDRLVKCDPGEEMWKVVERRMKLGSGSDLVPGSGSR